MKIEVELDEEISEQMREVASKFEQFGVHGGYNDGFIDIYENGATYRTTGGYEYEIRDNQLTFIGPRQSLKSGSRFIDIYLGAYSTNVVLNYGKDFTQARQKRVFEDLEYTLYTRNPLTLPFYFPHAGFEPRWLGMTKEQEKRFEELKENQEPYIDLISVLINKADDDEFIFDEDVNSLKYDNIKYTGE